jgi:hypothetical protein
MAPATLAAIDWTQAQVVVVFSRSWDPRTSFQAPKPLASWWEKLYDFVPDATPGEARSLVPFRLDAGFSRRGQWVQIYVNPALPRTLNSP